ncbi:hypothetical protein B0H13DRAFT_1865191 [Mycena leptocephala]|nr:hypothetical protein B0H13DRAFT_1865191 [Mycena leptocephala]
MTEITDNFHTGPLIPTRSYTSALRLATNSRMKDFRDINPTPNAARNVGRVHESSTTSAATFWLQAVARKINRRDTALRRDRILVSCVRSASFPICGATQIVIFSDAERWHCVTTWNHTVEKDGGEILNFRARLNLICLITIRRLRIRNRAKEIIKFLLGRPSGVDREQLHTLKSYGQDTLRKHNVDRFKIFSYPNYSYASILTTSLGTLRNAHRVADQPIPINRIKKSLYVGFGRKQIKPCNTLRDASAVRDVFRGDLTYPATRWIVVDRLIGGIIKGNSVQPTQDHIEPYTLDSSPVCRPWQTGDESTYTHYRGRLRWFRTTSAHWAEKRCKRFFGHRTAIQETGSRKAGSASVEKCLKGGAAVIRAGCWAGCCIHRSEYGRVLKKQKPEDIIPHPGPQTMGGGGGGGEGPPPPPPMRQPPKIHFHMKQDLYEGE